MKTAVEMKRYQSQMRSAKRETPAEKRFRLRLESAGVSFKRQMILGFYILDFVVPGKMAIVEIDGSFHADRAEYDAARDEFCRGLGYTVFRIQNDDVDAFDLGKIDALPNYSEKTFRSSLGYANARRSDAIRKRRH